MADHQVDGREPWSETLVTALIESHRQDRGPLLPILNDLLGRCGYVDERSIPLLASALNLSQAEVFGVITFYKDYRTQPTGAHLVEVCRAEACQSVGAESLAEHARARLGVGFGDTTPDRRVTLDQVFCLGNCALGPSVMIDGRLHGRVSPEVFDALVGTT
jgi:formate dehydrogenase subunit gamma